jgi:hypothetical protein
VLLLGRGKNNLKKCQKEDEFNFNSAPARRRRSPVEQCGKELAGWALASPCLITKQRSSTSYPIEAAPSFPAVTRT